MKKEIIKRIIVWIATVAIFLAGGTAVAKVISNSNNQPSVPDMTYELNTEEFEGVIAYGDTIDLSLITIMITENGVTTEVPVDASMITTHVDTTRVGTVMLDLNYAGKTFSIPVSVKYKVDFVVDGEVFKTIYTLNAAELASVIAPQKEGYTFSGWSSEIPDVLFENMTLTANYEANIPELSTIEATYGDELANITLPSNAAGAWQFDNAEGTVGNAGKRTFGVSFIAKGTDTVLKKAELTVNVAKREVKFDVFADFTYNGTRQEPTYTTDVDVKVSTWLDGDKNYTDAGEYNYHFEVDDLNYTGEAKGTYVIKPATVTVKIEDQQILANEALPKAEYQIIGFEGMSQEELAELIGLTIVYPDAVVVGEHKITAKASNPSIQLVVEEGTLTVTTATIEGIGEPKPIDGENWKATFGDLLSSVEFASHPNGKWAWETPDVLVGDAGKQTHVAVFTPSNSAFQPIKCEVEITVAPKSMVIEIVGTTIFDYDGDEQKISFAVQETNGDAREDLEVVVVIKDADGNVLSGPCINAGTYTVELSLADPNYSATKVATLTVNKINPEVNFEQSFNVVWTATLKLSDIKLPEGYAWANPDKRIETAVTAAYAVIYTPADTVNYNVMNGEITVEVAKATATIDNAKDSYTSIYNGEIFTITGVTASNEAELVYTYEDGTPFTGVANAGTYTIIITLPESDNYKKAEVTTTVTIYPAPNTDIVNFSQSAIYGDLAMQVIKLPESTTGTWSIEGADETTTVGNVGERKFTLIFTPANGNYAPHSEEITVTVSKASVGILDNEENVLPETDNRTLVYNTQAFVLPTGIHTSNGVSLEAIIKQWDDATQKYDIPVDEIRNAGRYTITYSYAGDDNHKGATATIAVEITQAQIAFVAAPTIKGWTYGSYDATANQPSVTVVQDYVQSAVRFEYLIEGVWVITAPQNAGNYKVRAVVADDVNGNYIGKISEEVAFTVEKITVDVPEYTKDYTYDGSTIKADIPTSNLYTITDDGHIDAREQAYTVTLTLKDLINYKWASEDANETNGTLTLTYKIGKAAAGLNSLTLPSYPAGGTPAPSVKANFNSVLSNITYKYYSDEACEDEIAAPTSAGKYYVKAIFAGDQNIFADETDPISFTVTQKQATINGVREDKTYVWTYNGNIFTIPEDVKASNGDTLVFTYEDGTPFTGVADAGEYKVVITLLETRDYKGDSVTVTVKINPADNNKDYVNTKQNKIYGDAIDLPTSTIGEWTIEGGYTTVGDVGTNYFYAVFTPANGNYNSKKVQIEVVVTKKVIPTPDAVNPSAVYDKTTKYSGVTSVAGLYTVTTDGAVNVGTHYAVLTLVDSKNFAWDYAANESETTRVTYVITPGTNSLTITEFTELWKFNENASIPAFSATAIYGGNEGVEIKYYLMDGDTVVKEITGGRPTDAGTYKVIFTTTDANCPILSEEKIFTIEKAAVTLDREDGEVLADAYSQAYNSNAFPVPSVVASNGEQVSVVIKKNGVVVNEIKGVGTYTITYGVAQTNNYLGETKTVTVTITPATVTVSVGNTEWIYNSTPVKPAVTVTKDFADAVTFKLQYSIDNGETWKLWDENIEALTKLAVGTYQVKAIVDNDANGNYIGDASDVVTFEIKKATTTITGAKDGDEFEKTYQAGGYTIPNLVTLGAAHGGSTSFSYAYKMWNAETEQYDISVDGIVDAGLYEVVITLDASKNYESTSITVYVTINKVAADTDEIIVKDAVYGSLVCDAITFKPNNFGKWSITGVDETTRFDGIGNKSFEVVFTPYKEYEVNYEAKTVEVTVTVAKAPVTITVTSGNISKYFDNVAVDVPAATVSNGQNNKITVIITKNGEVVTEMKTVGTYTITYSYAGDDNYLAAANKTITVTIEKATINFVGAPGVEQDLVYNPNVTISNPTISVAQSFVSNTEIYFEYRYSENEGATWTDWTLWDENTSVPTDAGMYQVRARVTANDNYANAETVISDVTNFTIAKAPVVITVNGQSINKNYDGVKVIAPEANADNGATVVVMINGKNPAEVEMKNFGTYTITYSYAGDDNYLAAETKTITVTITKATVTISKPDINDTDWTYGSDVRKPSATFDKNFAHIYNGQITFEYYSDAACQNKIDAPTKITGAGTYYVKAVFTGNNNLEAIESEATEFTIAKAKASIENVDLNTVYGKVYDGTPYVFPSNIMGSYAGAPAVQYEVITNHGEYTVTLILAETPNYTGATVEGVKVKIEQAKNTQSVTQATEIFYGDLVFNKITLPTAEGIEGTWHLETADGTLVNDTTKFSSATKHTFWAIYKSTTGNYEDRKVEVTVDVSKAPVGVPTVDNYGYDGTHHTPALNETNDYWVRENAGGTDHGTYTVKLELKDPANHAWKTSLTNVEITGTNNEFATITYVVSASAQNWDVAPTITQIWQYERANEYAYPYGYAKAKNGGVDIYYKAADADDSAFSKTDLPTLPGKYVARFITTDDNYDILTVDLTFEITKREITPPVDSKPHFTYTGDSNNPIKSGLTNGTGYTITDTGHINVGEYTAIATLTSPYYVWDDGNDATVGTDQAARSFIYYIDPDKIEISDLGVQDWEYNTSANAPTFILNVTEADKQHVAVTFKYYTENGVYLGDNVVPTQAGKYYVTAQATLKNGYANLTESDVETSDVFEITQAAATLDGVRDDKIYTTTYDGNEYDIESGISETHNLTLSFTYYKDDEPYTGLIQDAGTYKVVIALDANDANYNNYKLDPVEVTIVINKATVELADEYKSLKPVTFGQSISTIIAQLPQSPYGTWSIKEIELGNAGVDRTFTAIFTSTSKNHANNDGVEITVTVNKAPITFDGNTNRSETFKNGAFTVPTVTAISGEKSTYVITKGGEEVDEIKTVGTYTITYTFGENENYLGGSTQITFTVNKAQITFVNNAAPTIKGWTYGQYDEIANKPSITVDQSYAQDKVNFLYYYTVDGVADWRETPPVNAGEGYLVKAVVSDDPNGNYVGATSNEAPFSVAKATTYICDKDGNVLADDLSYEQIYNSEAFELPIVKTSNGVTLTPVITKNGEVVTSIVDADENNVYVVTYTYGGDSNFEAAETKTITVKITRATIKLNNDLAIGNMSDDVKWTFGENAGMPTVTSEQNFVANKIYYQYSYLINAKTNEWSAWITWSTEDVATASDATEVADVEKGIPTNACQYRLRAVVDTTSNYVGTATEDSNVLYFTIEKAPVTIIVNGQSDQGDYTGEPITPPSATATASDGATITVTVLVNGKKPSEVEIKNVGTYTITYSVAESTNYLGANEEITIIINKAPVTISKPVIDYAGWEYGMAVRQPSADFDQTFAYGQITFEYYSDAECQSKIDAPTNTTNAGKYYVKAVFAGNENLEYAESEATSFTIDKRTVTITVGDNISKEFDNIAVTLPIVKASNGVELTPVITKDGATVSEMKNVGAYTVTYSYAGDGVNYEAAESQSLTVTITQATIKFTGINITAWTYGQYSATVNKPSATVDKSFAESLIQYQYARWNSETDAWDAWADWSNPSAFKAGKYKIRAIVASDLVNNNYVGDEIEMADENAFTIAPKSASISATGGTSFTAGTYNGNAYTLADVITGISVTDGLAVKYTLNGNKVETLTNAGTYTIVITLDETDENYDNYTLSNPVEVTVTIEKLKIAINDLAVSGWPYNPAITPNPTYTLNVPAVDAQDVEISFAYYYADGTPVNGNPTQAGTYYVVATATPDNNNTNLEASGEVKSGNFEITKVGITLSGVDASYGRDYNGVAYSKDDFEQAIRNANSAYGLVFAYSKNGETYTADIVDVGEYVVTITLDSATAANYELETTVTTKIVIEKATVTITDLAIGGWTYGKTPNVPSAKFAETCAPAATAITFKYYSDAACTTEIPKPTTSTAAGTYYVRAFYAESDNFNAAETAVEVAVSFTIGKGDGQITGVNATKTYNTTYNGSTYTLPGIGKSHSEAVELAYAYSKLKAGTADQYENVDAISGVGTYQVVITLPESDNYDGDSVTVTVTVGKATVSFNTWTITGWQYHPTNANKVLPTVKANVAGTQIVIPAESIEIVFEYSVDGTTGWTTDIPSAVGTYYVRAFVQESDNYNASYSEVNEETKFEITVATVPVPNKLNIEKEFTYNDAVQKPTVPESAYYTITWQNANSEDYGTYTVTLTLNDTVNTKWDTNDGNLIGERVYTYTIAKKATTITIGNLTTEKNYDGVAITLPTATADSGATVTVLVNGTAPSQVTILNAGTYTVTYSVPESTNYLEATKTVTILINKATPTWDDLFTGEKFYQNRIDLVVDELVAKNGNIVVDGTFTFTSAFSATAGESTVTVTFTPIEAEGVDNYVDSCFVTYNTTFVPVAYLDNTTAYGTIEAALADANAEGKGVVWVRPYDTTLGPIYINKDITINPGVTLLLPYGANGDGRNTYDDKGSDVTLHGKYDSCPNHTGHGNSFGLATDEMCHVKVVIANGVTVTNKGTIEVSGQRSGGGAGEQYAGHTGGLHAQLHLDANSKIDNYGTIFVAGFIREIEENNNSTITVFKDGTLQQPYVLMDYISGGYMAGPYMSSPAVTPFNLFLIMNVAPKVTVNYGASVELWATLYTGSTGDNNRTKVVFVGTNGVIQLSPGAHLTAKYGSDKVTELHIYGGATTSSMTLTVTIGKGSLAYEQKVDTIKVLFPISYLYDITLHDGEYTMGQKFKMMPGAKLTVAAGATLDIDTLIVYDETFVDGRALAQQYLYPNGKGAAIFTVNGSVTIGTFGGKVYSDTEGAMITIETNASYTAYEPKVYRESLSFQYVDEGEANRYIINKNTELVNADATKVILANATTGEYVNGVWVVPDSLKLHFNSNGGNAQTSMDILSNDASYPTLPIPTRDHYVFAGWKDSKGNLVTQGSAIKVDRDIANGITLTAQWTPVEYNLNYEWKFEGFGTNPTITWAESLGKFTIETAKITLPTPTNATGSFVGWYTDAECGNVILNGTISGAELVALYNGNATIYGLWTNQQYTIKFEGDTFNDVPYTNDTVVYTPTQLPTATLPTIPNTYETDVTVDKYFEGWYYNGTKVTDFSFINDSVQEYTLTAKWVDKVSITYTASDTSIYTGLITNGSEALAYGTAYWYKSGTTITLANVTANDNAVTDSSKLNYCQSLTLNGATFDKSNANNAYTLSENTVIHITWGTKTTVKVDAVSSGEEKDAKYRLYVSTTQSNDGLYYTGSEVKNEDATYYVIPEHYIKFTVTAPNGYSEDMPTEWTAVGTTEHSYEVKYNESCLIEGTLITMADGTQKPVEDLTVGDMVLIFNHVTGQYEAAPIIFNTHKDSEADFYDVLHLFFSNGEEIKIVASHGFFDLTLMQYVYITYDNYNDYIGHEFYFLNSDSETYEGEAITLTEAYITNEYTRIFCPVSYFHMNSFANGALNTPNIPGDITGLVNYFEYDSDLKYNEEAMARDIEEYGLYTYEDFSEYISYEAYMSSPAVYLKVSVGKGMITYEQIIDVINYLLEGSLIDADRQIETPQTN